MVEVERILAGSVDLYISDEVLEFLMSYRELDALTKESVYPAARALELQVTLGLIADVLEVKNGTNKWRSKL